ncbi:hypothetical protein ACGFNV_46050 [Streptomyces sp. NPDC048751]
MVRYGKEHKRATRQRISIHLSAQHRDSLEQGIRNAMAPLRTTS